MSLLLQQEILLTCNTEVYKPAASSELTFPSMSASSVMKHSKDLLRSPSPVLFAIVDYKSASFIRLHKSSALFPSKHIV